MNIHVWFSILIIYYALIWSLDMQYNLCLGGNPAWQHLHAVNTHLCNILSSNSQNIHLLSKKMQFFYLLYIIYIYAICLLIWDFIAFGYLVD